MARPAIDKERYMEAIEQMRAEGLRADEITATRLQKTVGGQYSRCVALVEEYQATTQADRAEEAPPMPTWFREFVLAIQQAAEGTWFRIASEMKKSVDDLTAAFQEKRMILEAQRREDLEQIQGMEKAIDEHEQAIEKARVEASAIAQEKAKLAEELAANKAELAGSEKRKAELVAELVELRKENRDLDRLLAASQQRVKDLEEANGR